jgi:hypothetical protein
MTFVREDSAVLEKCARIQRHHLEGRTYAGADGGKSWRQRLFSCVLKGATQLVLATFEILRYHIDVSFGFWRNRGLAWLVVIQASLRYSTSTCFESQSASLQLQA